MGNFIGTSRLIVQGNGHLPVDCVAQKQSDQKSIEGGRRFKFCSGERNLKLSFEVSVE